jgi:hypothetical protein
MYTIHMFLFFFPFETCAHRPFFFFFFFLFRLSLPFEVLIIFKAVVV